MAKPVTKPMRVEVGTAILDVVIENDGSVTIEDVGGTDLVECLDAVCNGDPGAVGLAREWLAHYRNRLESQTQTTKVTTE